MHSQAFNVEPSSREELSSAIKKLEDLITEGEELLSWEKLPANSYKMTNRPTTYKTAPTPPPAVFGRDNDVKTITGMLRDTPAAGDYAARIRIRVSISEGYGYADTAIS